MSATLHIPLIALALAGVSVFVLIRYFSKKDDD